MTDEIQLRKDLDRGARAERILKDELVLEAFQIVEKHIFGKFKEASVRDDEGVLKTKQLLHAASLFRRVFEDAVRDGQIAATMLERMRKGTDQFLGDVWKSRRPRSQ